MAGKQDKSAAKKPRSKKSKVEEPKVEEPVVEEPKVEEPVVEERVVEEPKVEEPVVEEPVVEERVDDDSSEETDEDNSAPSRDTGDEPEHEDGPDAEGEPEEVEVVEHQPDDVTEFASVGEVAEYLTTPGIDIETKLNNLVKGAPLSIRSLVGSLLGYAAEGNSDAPTRSPEYVLGKTYNLYSVIKAVIETKDSDEFRVKMDIVNLVVMSNSANGEAFNALRLLRYDYQWRWGEQSLKTHQVLMTVITALANRATREEKLSKINLNNSFARDGLTISQEHIERLVRYYS